MDKETLYRLLFILAFIAMTAIRLNYQSKVLHEKRQIEIKEGGLSVIAGSLAALTTLVFGAEYVFFPGFFSFAYRITFPDWSRWFGGFILAVGIFLMGYAHHHLGQSFHSLVVSKEEHILVETGPYKWIRHPIYTEFLINYFAGGLLSSNWVLTVVPVTMYAILVGIRMGQEEKVLEGLFGQKYIEYEERTGRLLPRVKIQRQG